MQYCINHPEEISKLSKLKAQITEVKGIMMDNIEKVCISFLEDWYCGKIWCVILKVEIKCSVTIFFQCLVYRFLWLSLLVIIKL